MYASLVSRAVSGVRWTLVNVVVEKLLSFGTTVVLARMLDPEHFGLYALAFVVIDSFQIVKNLGLDAALIQRKDHVEEAADTAFMTLPVIGTALFGLLFLVAPTLARWLGNPQVGGPMQALGAVLILMSIGNVPAALVQKAMRFEIRTVANLSGMVVYAGLAIALARHGWGVWSLVVAYLARWTVTIPIQWVLLGWAPRWRFRGAMLREMLHFSKYVVGAWIVGLLAINADKVAIGRWLGATQLGYYTLCLGLANIVLSQLGAQVYLVAFPAFSVAQGQPDLFRRGVLKLMKYLSVFSLPSTVLLAVASRDVLEVVYGSRWVVAAPILQVLALGAVPQTVRSGLEPVLLGCGQSRTVFRLNLLQLGILSTGTVTMARLGSSVGVAWAAVIASAVPAGISLGVILRRIEVRPAELARHLRPVVLSALLMGGALIAGALVRYQGGSSVSPPWLRLSGLVSLGGVVYLLGLRCWDRPVLRDLLHVVRSPITARTL